MNKRVLFNKKKSSFRNSLFSVNNNNFWTFIFIRIEISLSLSLTFGPSVFFHINSQNDWNENDFACQKGHVSRGQMYFQVLIDSWTCWLHIFTAIISDDKIV